MRKQLLLLLFSLFAVAGYARTITGVVTSDSDSEPLIGASIQIKGTTRGVVTDFDGNFTIDASDSDILSISYVGMDSKTVEVGSQSVFNVVLSSNTQVLEEVVVTAMGQTQEKKKLNFAVQSLDSDEVTAGSSTNIASNLQGKVSGLQVASTGGSPNSSSQLTIRAISSINTSQSNEPLIIMDGVPVSGSGSTLGSINPNDIESMTVLKGAAASALYGQEAANGVIMITTKSGKDGKVQITASAGFEVSQVANQLDLQTTYGSGSSGFYKQNSAGGWGSYLSEGTEIYDNAGDFFGTGVMQRYDATFSGGNDLFKAYASIGYYNNEGVVQGDYKNQLNIFVKGEFNPSDKVKISLSTNVIESKFRSTGGSLSTVYGWAIDKDMSDYETVDGLPNWSNRYDNWDALSDDSKLSATASPYYSINNDSSLGLTNRTMLNGQISYEPIKNLFVSARVGYDKSYTTYDSYTVPRYDYSEFPNTDEDVLTSYQSKFGTYSYTPSRSEQISLQGMVTYEFDINDDFTFNVMAGGEYKDIASTSASLEGDGFVLDGDFYSFTNIDPDSFLWSDLYVYHTNSNKFGYFGEIRFDYRGMAQLSVTGRYDGSSTLVQVDPTYFYPSVTGGVIFSEIFNISNDWFSYGKLRGNWAKVGKDAPTYRFSQTYSNFTTFPDGGWIVNSTTATATDLEPEMTSSWEIGTDLRFFNSKTRLDLAYYSTTVDNQIVTVRVSPASGTILQTRNEGSIKNHGVELSLNQDIIKNKDFSWTAFTNFSLNRGTVLSLPDQLTEIAGTQYGDIYPTAYLNGSTTAISGKDYERTENGDIIIGSDGYPIISSEKTTLIGDREASFLIGVGSAFSWKNLSASFLFDCRSGGDVVNVTGRSLVSSGMSELLSEYRNREIVWTGVVETSEGVYETNTKSVILDQTTVNTYYYAVSSNFIEDGSYIRLSYVTLAYDFTDLLRSTKTIKGLKASLTGRNLFLLTSYSGSDPQITASSSAGGTGSGGIDNYSVPTTRSFNLTLTATF
ncbi:MAG: SusC/RagA family TonB-linked outer membrane protein [Bacteroidales bacterium]